MLVYLYIGILILGILYCIYNIGNILARPGKEYQNHMMIVFSVIIISLLAYIFEISSITRPGKIIAIRMEVTANAFANIFFLLYLLRFCNYKIWKSGPILFGICHIAGLLCLYTTAYHGLYYESVSLVRDQGMVSIALEKGPMYYAYIAFNFMHMPIYEYACFSRFKSSAGRSRKMYQGLMIAGFIPYVMYVIYATGITGPYDITSLGFLAFAIMISITVRKYGIVDIVSIAKDKLISDMASGILVTDEAGNIKYANPVALGIFPHLEQELDEGIKTIQVDDLLQLKKHKVYCKNRVYDCNCINMNEKQIMIGSIYVLHEITEMEKMVRRDSMTGLYNHAAFFDLLEQGAERCNFDNQRMSIAFLDIDDFKKVNDSYGHSNGDRVLMTLTDIMKHHCYDKAYPCRYGGEEFAIIFEGDNSVYAKEIMDSILQELSAYPFEFCKHKITFSCAICHYQKGNSISEFFANTDKLLYDAKRNGKNQIYERVS